MDHTLLYDILSNLVAHFIRNPHAKMSRAVCDLRSHSRWAVTGTPIQNRLTDLSALLNFIQAHPYDDMTRFDKDITQLWKSGDDQEAVRRLQTLSKCLLLRRAKDTIQLPTRRDHLCAVDFSIEEREAYENIRNQVATKVDEALDCTSAYSRASAYVNVLQQIESLRLFCLLGMQYDRRHDTTRNPSAGRRAWSQSAQRVFNSQWEMGHVVCLQCSSTVDITDVALDAPDPSTSKCYFSECLKFICSDCVQKLDRLSRLAACGHKPSCTMAPVSTSGHVLEDTLGTEKHRMQSDSGKIPSKIRALLKDLKAVPTDVKW